MSATPEERHDKSPEEIRDEIEQTREELGDTVETLAAKTDVKMQVKKRIAQVKDTAQDKKDQFASQAREVTPDSASAGAEQVVSTVRSRPLPFTALAAFAAGLLVGRLLGRR